MTLSLDEPNRIAPGAIDKAEALGIRVSAAVCDGNGRLVAFQRVDSAIWPGAYGS
jgi:glc operon protein GlcG